jgi:hypothetical protein
MSTFISEPGTRLGGRYRLEDRTAAAGGWAAWKAIDEILARPVTVVTFEPGFPRVRETVTAARAAGRLTDARLTQVFDVEDDWDHAYIVMEWAAGDSLDDLLAAGPVDPGRATQIIAEAAAALSVAHAAGLAHLCLQPGSLRWTPNSGVKIVGLGVDAALTGITSEDPAADDTRGLASLLYATLTGHWPGPDCPPSLTPAPSADGRARRPRQITAGVPAVLDDITCRALFQQDRRGASALSTPGELAEELTAAIPPAPPPEAAPPQPTRGYPVHGYPASTVPGRTGYEPSSLPPGGWDTPPPAGPRPQRGRQRPSRNLIGIATVLVLVVVAAITIGTMALNGSSPHGQLPSSVQSPNSPSTQAAQVLKPIGAQGVSEPSTKAALAIDSSPATAWSTQYYLNNPKFGGLKNGSGLLLDMGKTVKLSSVAVTFGSTPGADVSIKLGNDGSADPGAVSSFTTVAQQNGVPGGTTTFNVRSSASGRYLLIWFTKLPPKADGGPSGSFGASIFNIIVKGSSTS